MPSKLFKTASIDQVSKIQSVESAVDWMFDCCRVINADKMSYHFHSETLSSDKEIGKIFSHGYPDSWVLKYSSGELQNCDPVAPTVMTQGKAMTWGEALSNTRLTDSEKAFIAQAQKNGLIHGVGLPLWGPKECDAYVAIGFPDPVSEHKRQQVAALQLFLQTAHQKICELVAEVSPVPRLSKRETEILTWVARGKSNTDIATILDLSVDTVRTYLQRIFAKLGSRNRIGAAIRALRLGLIRI